MQPPPPSDEVRRFVAATVRSVPYLEAMLLARSEQQKVWDATALAGRLYVGRTQAAGLLEALSSAGVVRAEGAQGFVYAPQDDALRAVIDQLADAYARNLTGITDLIHSSADQRAYQFADAFRIRKDK